MILTKEIFNAGRSIRGSWSSKQLRLLDVTHPRRNGWQRKLIGSNFPESNIKLFLALKDKHLINKKTGEIKDKYIREPKEIKFKHKPKPLVGPLLATKVCGFLEELLGCNQSLTRWEIDFIDKLQYHKRFSIKQAAFIGKLRQKVFNIGFFI